MVCTVHYKLNARCNLTKFAYYEFIAVPFIKMCNVTVKIRIGNIRKVTNNYIWIFGFLIVGLI